MGFDEDDSPYVVHQNHRIYVLPYAYSQLMLEQNVNSPHRYLGGAIPEIEQGSVFVDVGAAEGIMAVESLKRASKVYVIERDPSWLSRLNKTFSGEKNVTIINKYASCKDDEENITLDTLLDKVTEPILIKLDVEGMELEVLLGAENLLKKENVKLLIATYHKPGDPETLQAYMEERGFCTEFTDGYIAPMWPGVTAPYLRKALLRAWKE
ncbi:MAG: FkbM family methyltransferase [Lachnospiraceae bacterium]|nr:FkbM family methyltransferase [Lachnospiraceae bacterium]